MNQYGGTEIRAQKTQLHNYSFYLSYVHNYSILHYTNFIYVILFLIALFAQFYTLTLIHSLYHSTHHLLLK
jgi:hypothetical protein